MLGLLGINHTTAPLEIREKFSFTNDEIVQFAETLSEIANFNDIVVLATCNRTEIYFSQKKYNENIALGFVKEALVLCKHIDEALLENFYVKFEGNVVKHLFSVTSGLDSMVLGEDQILSQVKDAYLFCTEAALTDAVLMRLFQKSFEAGKRVRTETKLNCGATSMSFVAVDFCNSIINNIQQKTVLLIGAGETAALVMQAFFEKGVRNFIVSNRSQEKADALVQRYSGKSVGFDSYPMYLSQADVIITATASKTPLVTSEMISATFNGNQQLYIDLSVPRNIEAIESLPTGVSIITIDDIQKVIEANTQKRKDCVSSAEVIIDEVVAEFMEWLSFRALRPVLRAIKFNLQNIHREEMKNQANNYKLADLQIIDSYCQKLITKYERALIKNLKDLTENGKNTDSLRMINKLFKLE
ncbi:MAG: glutamyl-tRNA reductase [Bacteroidales bacterium]|nr:glutamyl-tRNA reductase [Bacteroidales bacterium]